MEPVKDDSKSGDFQLSSENLYGKDSFKFGVLAEKAANFLGTPKYIFGQTIVILIWLIWNISGWNNFDHYPFEFLVLVVSLQAAYAAPLILLAQTRQDVREDRREAAEIEHREKLDLALAERTGEIHHLLKDVHHVIMELDEVIEEMHNYNVRENGWRGQNDSDYR
jgi:uncharacterized membrane protein